ncbi:MAG: hypothetical protein HY674_15055, partial [Chloroflexi bacterium]|nr:hypothetical protein [Chloroflexota bacterium]
MTLRHSISLLFLAGVFASGGAVTVFAAESELSQGAEAAALSYHHQTWTPDDGLPDNAVDCLLQTRDGWLWIGTRSGLARFDGVQFTVFNGRTPGFTDDAILALAEDLSGNLWIATKKGLYRKTGGVFT